MPWLPSRNLVVYEVIMKETEASSMSFPSQVAVWPAFAVHVAVREEPGPDGRYIRTKCDRSVHLSKVLRTANEAVVCPGCKPLP